MERWSGGVVERGGEGINHGSRFAQTVLRNATQVKRLRQDKMATGWSCAPTTENHYSRAYPKTLFPNS